MRKPQKVSGLSKKRKRAQIALWALIGLVIAASLGLMAYTHLHRQRRAAADAQNSAAENLGEALTLSSSAAKAAYGEANGPEGAVVRDGKTYVPNQDIDNYLFLGLDTAEERTAEQRFTKGAGQSDAIYLLSYNRRAQTLRALAIPRDTMTRIATFAPSGKQTGYAVNHLNLQFAFGDGKHQSCALSRDAVSNLLYGTPIRGYVAMRMAAMEKLSDLVGGVTITVPDDTLRDADPAFAAGAEVTLTGDNTETFLRSRDTAQENSALVRQQHQIVYLKAFAKKLQEEQRSDAGTVTRVFNALQSDMITSMGNDVFVKMATASFDGEVTNLPGEGAFNEKTGFDEFHVDENALWDLVIDDFYQEMP